jgi:hypothetical protein
VALPLLSHSGAKKDLRKQGDWPHGHHEDGQRQQADQQRGATTPRVVVREPSKSKSACCDQKKRANGPEAGVLQAKPDHVKKYQAAAPQAPHCVPFFQSAFAQSVLMLKTMSAKKSATLPSSNPATPEKVIDRKTTAAMRSADGKSAPNTPRSIGGGEKAL